MRLCESERRYRELEHSGTLKNVIGAYAIGQRSSDILDTLARARVWADNIGEWLPCPVGYDRTTWHDILDALVLGRLGNRRCLDCGSFFSDQRPNATCFICYRENTLTVPYCPECGSTTTEVIGLTEGVVR